ncbi:MAG TPA: secretion system protein F [Anaerolineae bacterium]|nr:secretion system protein F [Anaerolineae bacterium]HID85107.1 secretion system protein F [Anaerolineales bacterium]HIQ08518.1 secretion system protein F [Anaerolineaceae bacterium]
MSPVLLITIGGGLALILLVVGLVLSIRGERAQLEKRLEQYLQDEMEADELRRSREPGALQSWLDRQVERTEWWGGIARGLSQADLRLRPAEYIALRFLALILGGLVGYAFGGGNALFTLLGVVLGWMGPGFYVRLRRSQRLTQFNAQLPDMLNLMVNSLRAGYSTQQAMEAVSRELPPPISTEFRRVTQELQIGIPMEWALENLLRRVPSDDLDLVVTAILVQREVGGNLAEVLETISETIRERVRVQGEIRTLTAQVRLSGTIISLIPFVLFLIIYRIAPDYMGQFLRPENRVCGLGMLGTALTMIGLGYYIMQRISKIEV